MLNVLSNAECAQVAFAVIRTRFCFKISELTRAQLIACASTMGYTPEQPTAFPPLHSCSVAHVRDVCKVHA